MKKYTQPTVEITAFDFEDITMSSLGVGTSDAGVAAFIDDSKDDTLTVDARGIIW